MNSTSHHISILLQPITDFLIEGIRELPAQSTPGVLVDCTFGGGGHTRALLEGLQQLRKQDPSGAAENVKVLATDQDPEAITRGRIQFAPYLESGQLELHHQAFSTVLSAVGSRPIYGITADLGISSDQIDSDQRGFSFRFPAPLDMRMNTTQGSPLSECFQRWSEAEIADILWNYGEERASRKIARRLIEARQKQTLPQDTQSLAQLIAGCLPPAQRHGRIHPATRSFQAFRIAINGELDELDTLIRTVFSRVVDGGRLAVLSFHSLEDRRLKQEFHQRDEYELPQRKAIQADEAELEQNPRSRSAKLRLAIKRRRVNI